MTFDDLVAQFREIAGEKIEDVDDWLPMLTDAADLYGVEDMRLALNSLFVRSPYVRATAWKRIEDFCVGRKRERERTAAPSFEAKASGGVAVTPRVDSGYLKDLFACQQTNLADRVKAQAEVDKRYGKRWDKDPTINIRDVRLLRETELHLGWMAATQGWVKTMTVAGLAWCEQKFAKHLAQRPTWESYEEWRAER